MGEPERASGVSTVRFLPALWTQSHSSPDESVPDTEDRPNIRTPRPDIRRESPRSAPTIELPEPESSGSDLMERALRWVFAIAAIGAIGWVLWYFAAIVVYLVVGGVLAYLLQPVVDRLQGIGLGRIPAILLTFVLVFGVVAILLTFIVPFLARQVGDLSQLISVEAAESVARYLEERLQAIIPVSEGAIEDNMRQAVQALLQGDLVGGQEVASTVSSVVLVFTNIFYAVLIVPFVTFFFLKDGAQIRRSLLSWVPNRYFEVTLAIIDKVETNIGRYFRALLLQCFSIAVVASSLLYLVGLNEALAVGIFAGLANTIPYFGPFLGFIAGTLVGVAQTGDFSLVLGILIAMGLTQVSDNLLFQPLIFSRAAQAHPMVILFVVLMGAQLAGIVGMLIAIPLATTVRVIVEQVLWSWRNYRILHRSA